MEPECNSHVQAIPLPFHKALKSVCRSLEKAGIGVVEQMDLSREFSGQAPESCGGCALLLVDSPLLLFEALALDPAAAVFMPLHLVVRGDHERTCVHWAHPAAFGLRLPATAKGPVDALYLRVTQLLEQAQAG